MNIIETLLTSNLWIMPTLLVLVIAACIVHQLPIKNMNDYVQHAICYVVVTLFTMTFPGFFCAEKIPNIFERIIKSVFNSLCFAIRALAVANEFNQVDWLTRTTILYRIVIWGLLIIAPILTAGLVVSIFGISFYNIKYKLMRTGILRAKHVYIFSELNNDSLNLACSIKQKNQNRCRFFFCNVSPQNPLLEKCYKTFSMHHWGMTHSKIAEIKLPARMFSDKNHYFYFLMEEKGNHGYTTLHLLNQAICTKANASLNDFGKYKGKNQKVRIFLFQSTQAGDRYVDNERRYLYRHVEENKPVSEQEIRKMYTMQSINKSRILAYSFLMREPFSKYAAKKEDSVHHLNVLQSTILLIGDSELNKEFIKIITWAGKMGHINMTYYLCAENASNIKNELETECPEIAFSIDQFIDTPLKGESFNNWFREIQPDVNYIIVRDSTDQASLDAAMYLYAQYEKLWTLNWEKGKSSNRDTRALPLAVYLDNEDNQNILQQIEQDRRTEFDIHKYQDKHRSNVRFKFIGDPAFYSYETLFTSEFVKEFQKYCRPELGYPHIECNGQYGQHSASGKALTLQLRRALYKEVYGKNYQTRLNNKEKLLKKEAKYEHERWCEYIKTEGFQAVPKEKIRSYYDDMQKHINRDAKLDCKIVSWKGLKEVDKEIEGITGQKQDSQKKALQIIKETLDT